MTSTMGAGAGSARGTGAMGAGTGGGMTVLTVSTMGAGAGTNGRGVGAGRESGVITGAGARGTGAGAIWKGIRKYLIVSNNCLKFCLENLELGQLIGPEPSSQLDEGSWQHDGECSKSVKGEVQPRNVDCKTSVT